MNDETAKTIEQYRAKLGEINRLQTERAQLVGVGTVERRRVTVTVNADGITIDIKFSSDIGDLDYDEIAAAITEASQLAVADVAEQTSALFAPIAPDPAGRIEMDEALSGIANMRDQLR